MAKLRIGQDVTDTIPKQLANTIFPSFTQQERADTETRETSVVVKAVTLMKWKFWGPDNDKYDRNAKHDIPKPGSTQEQSLFRMSHTQQKTTASSDPSPPASG